jgi:hypothetical protein
MRIAAACAIAFVAAGALVVACVEVPAAPEADGVGGSCPEFEPDTGEAISGGNPEPYDCSALGRPVRIRTVHVVDSRALDPNTLVLAESPDPQTLWLPRAADNIGAFVVVKESLGAPRRVTVIAIREDDSTVEYETTDALSSRTFMVVVDSMRGPVWFLLDAVTPGT